MASERVITDIELETFKNHFRGFNDHYVLIGGSAALLLLESQGLSARTTQDLDLVLCAKALSREFVNHFWKFIIDGKYIISKSKQANEIFFRFDKPGVSGYPYMIELLSERPELFEFVDQTTLPLVLDDEIISLSAIMLDSEYYEFLMNNRKDLDGITVADEHVIIPLKVRAFLDLSKKKEEGLEIRGDDIRKHRNDVVRLSALLKDEPMNNVPVVIKDEMKAFISQLKDEGGYLSSLKTQFTDMDELKKILSTVYQLE